MNHVTRGACVGIVFCLIGCGTKQHMIVASTSTVIGLDVAQSADGKGVQTAFGYKRQELAVVPTDRMEAGDKTAVEGGKGAGASNTGDVVMELAYGTKGTDGPDVYQRLAVGRNAVNSFASLATFFRKPDGTIDAEGVNALTEAAPSIKALSEASDGDR